jgi:hypothetical protein
MNKYFLCRIKYDKINQDGNKAVATEIYIVEAPSHAAAEVRIIAEMQEYTHGEVSVESVRKQKISDIFNLQADIDTGKWYKARVVYIALNDDETKEKRTAINVLARTANIASALHDVEMGVCDVCNYEIVSICETPIVSIFPYQEQDEENFYDE